MSSTLNTRRRYSALAFTAALLLAACSDDDGGSVTTEGASGSGSASASGSGSGSGSASSAGPSAGDDAYSPVSDVASHAAVGQDAAAIRELLAPAKEGDPVDWTSVAALWEKGGASKKGDGSVRTLQTLVEDPVVAFVDAAIAGTGGSADVSDAVRAQQVDKGITVVLARKVMGELDAAAEKVTAGETNPAEGAPHNVDEAWAFFTAEEQGPALTADKRGADFKADDVRSDVVDALVEAQKAAGEGDKAAMTAAIDATRDALDRIFYLATFKYLAAEDEVGRAEGAAFYLGIADRVEAADAEAHATITAAFRTGDAAAGRAALNSDAVLAALGIDADEQVEA